MTNTRSAAATGLPTTTTTRRAALTSLAGVGAALGFSQIAKAAISLDAPDAVLIAHAAMVEEMIARSNAAWERHYQLEDKVQDVQPKRPESPGKSDRVETVEREPDGTLLSIRLKPADPAEAAATRHYEAALGTWEAAVEALKEDMGANAAEALADDLYQALKDMVRDLTPMVPKSLAGLAAKARCAVALDPHQDLLLNGWENALVASVARDALAIGGAA